MFLRNFTILVLSFSMLQCSNFLDNFNNNIKVRLIFPPLPEYLKSNSDSLKIKILSYRGIKRVLSERVFPFESSVFEDGIEIKISKALNTPVMMIPVMSNVNIPFKPAGAIFPLGSFNSLDGYTLTMKLEWEKGPLCRLLFILIDRGVPVENINIERLNREIESLYIKEPSFLDTDYLASKLISGNFRVTYVRKKEIFTEVFYPGKGEWFFNLVSSPAFIVEDGKTDFISYFLAEGLYYLFNSDFSTVYYVFIDEKGEVCLEKDRF